MILLMKKLSFAIVHNDPLQAEKLRVLLIADGCVSEHQITVISEPDALEPLSAERSVDVILVGWSGEPGSDIAILQDIERLFPSSATVFFTEREDPALAAQALAAGVQDIVIKGWISGQTLMKTVIHAVERMKLVNRLDATNKRLIRINEEKNRFLGMATHDLRGPIGNIASFVDLILADAADRLGADNIEFLSRMKRSSIAMVSLIDELLDTSRIEAGELILHPVSVNLAGFIKECVEEMLPVANRKSIAIGYEVANGMSLAIDTARIAQVIDNLVSNAIKYSLPGAKVMIRAKTFGDTVEIRVEDTGPGIPHKDFPQIFDPFFRSTAKPTAGEASTGLGLFIVKRIVEKHGGEVGLESIMGQGTTFWFRLPAPCNVMPEGIYSSVSSSTGMSSGSS